MVLRSLRVKESAELNLFSDSIDIGAKARFVVVEYENDSGVLTTTDLQTYLEELQSNLKELQNEVPLEWRKA